MSTRKILILLALIFTLSTTVRLYRVGQIPNGLTVDEADMGYNAYSMLKTGKDVYGRTLPLFFQSLDDYKPSFAIYSTIPAINFFSLSDFSVRLTPALIGAITPLLFYFLIKLMFPKEKYAPFIGALLIALAPWHIAISRATFMYVDLVFVYLLSFVLFFFAILKKPFFLILSAASLAASLYVYYAAIIYLPFILVLVFLIFKKELLKNSKVLMLSLAVLILISLPAVLHYSSSKSKTRLNAISVLTPDITLPHSINQSTYDKKNSYPFSQIFHNRRIVYTSAMLDNYFDYFNLDYLFVSAKNIRYFYTNYTGLFYLLELPLFLAGLFVCLKNFQKVHKLLLGLLVIGPISAMITLGSPFIHRATLMLPVIQIIVLLGFIYVVNYLRQKKVNFKITLLAISTLYAFSVIFFLHQYFVHSPREFSTEIDNSAWFSTIRNLIPYLNENKKNYDKIVFSWSSQKLVPGIYYLFYNRIDPAQIQKKASLWTNETPSYKQLYNSYENIEFKKIDWESDKLSENTLLIGYPEEFPKDLKNVVNVTYLKNGDTHLIFVEVNTK